MATKFVYFKFEANGIYLFSVVHMIIEGFRTTGDPKLMAVAQEMATQWLIVNYKSYSSTYAMFEKYNVSLLSDDECSAGGGGEYEVLSLIYIQLSFTLNDNLQVQKGFGWSNGVILDLLNSYGDKMSASKGVITGPTWFSGLFIAFVFYCISLH